MERPDGTDGTVDLSDPTSPNPTFYVDMFGNYTATLIVNDGKVDSAPDTVLISTANVPPAADAGPDQPAHIGDTVILDGSGSYDPDWDVIPTTPLNYNWTLTDPDGFDATSELSNPGTVNPSFTVTIMGDYIATLVVNDGADNSAPDNVIISTENVKPVANPGADFATYTGSTVILNGSGSNDADEDPITFQWSLTSVPVGSSATLMNPTTVTPSLTPDIVGFYIVSLVVNDGYEDSDPRSITITVVTPENAAAVVIGDTINEINSFDSSVFVNKNSAKALTNKLNAVISDLLSGNTQDVLDKLENDLLPKTDGCAFRGSPDTGGGNVKDWITDCAVQVVIYPLILDAIATLQ